MEIIDEASDFSAVAWEEARIQWKCCKYADETIARNAFPPELSREQVISCFQRVAERIEEAKEWPFMGKEPNWAGWAQFHLNRKFVEGLMDNEYARLKSAPSYPGQGTGEAYDRSGE